MEAGLREVCRSVRIGKILIQRVRVMINVLFFPPETVLYTSILVSVLVLVLTSALFSLQDEETALPKLFYSKVRNLYLTLTRI
jgi:hypothetical protein